MEETDRKEQEGEQRELCEQQIWMHMMQMAQTGTLENHFYMLALMFKSTLQKRNDKFSLLERILLQSRCRLFPTEKCFPCMDLSPFVPSVMRAWAMQW